MKKLLLSLLFLPLLLAAQERIGSVKAGFFSPSATESGFIIGYEGNWKVDDNFMFGFSADWFNKKFVDEKLVDDFDKFFGPISSQLNELRAKTNLHSIPLMFTINASKPIAPKTKAYFTAGAGLDILLIFYRNYENPENDEFQGAFDFAWRIGAGVSYELGERSDVFGELAYLGSKPSWEYEVKVDSGRKKIFERQFDMSGFMLRFGFKFRF